MYTGVQSKVLCIFQEINNYHPNYLGQPIAKLMKKKLGIEDCLITIAHEFGYSSMEEFNLQSNVSYDEAFEASVDALINGQVDVLKKRIVENPTLSNQHSQYGHQATLLHYAVANGVELWRQQTPLNLPEMVQFLMDHGADRHLKMKVYGGHYAPLELLPSSAHPREAGIAGQLEKLLMEE